MSEDAASSLGYPHVVPWSSADERAEPSEARDPRAVVTEHFLVLQPSLNRFIRWRIGNRDDADELTQEVFLRLYVHMRSGHSVANVRAWTFAVARHLVIDAKRQFRADPTRYAVEPTDILCEREGIDCRLERIHREAAIEAAIECLPALQRQCLDLRAEGLRLREVAERLGCTISTVASSLQRAFTSVRRRVDQDQVDEQPHRRTR